MLKKERRANQNILVNLMKKHTAFAISIFLIIGLLITLIFHIISENVIVDKQKEVFKQYCENALLNFTQYRITNDESFYEYAVDEIYAAVAIADILVEHDENFANTNLLPSYNCLIMYPNESKELLDRLEDALVTYVQTESLKALESEAMSFSNLVTVSASQNKTENKE